MKDEITNLINNLSKSNNIDKELEIFWLGFKTSIINFINQINHISYIRRESTILSLNIISNKLNILQAKYDYRNIEKLIQKYIIHYGYLICKYANYYYINIFDTNVKRWNKISKNYKIEINKFCVIDKLNKKNLFYIIYKILFSIQNYNIKNKSQLSFNFDEMQINNNIIFDLFNFGYDNNLPQIISLISLNINIKKYIHDRFHAMINFPISGEKLLSLLKKIEN
jgi:hypothetical protein